MVVANPPYMGSSSLGKWMGAWVKKHYPEAYRDLCTSFIDQGFGMSSDNGYSAMVTMQSWMFLGSFEKLRGKILRNHSISSMAHLGTRAFGAIGGEVVSTTATVFTNAKCEVKGAYFRLVDMGSEEEKQAGLLEALANPDCGWFYRASSAAFETVPGNPIAYWASDGVRRTFVNGIPLEKVSSPRQGLATGENERFLREWWEVSQVKSEYDCYSLDDLRNRRGKWIPYNKGGEYRKWYGNNDYVIAFDKDSYDVLANQGNHLPSRQLYFRPSITWSKISSGVIAFRFKPQGGAFDVAGTSIFGDKLTLEYLQGLCNSSLIMQIAALLSPTLNFEVGQIASYPVIMSDRAEGDVCNNVESARYLSKIDYDSFETSWDFEKHPLI